MFVLVAPSQVRFGYTDHFSVLLEQAEVLGFVLVGHVQVGFVGDLLVGHKSLRFGFQLMDELVDHFLVQGYRRIHIGPLIKSADELALAKRDIVRSRVGDGNLADLVVVEGNQRGPSCQVSMARSGERGELSRIPKRNNQRVEGLELSRAGHLQDVGFIGDAEHLLGLGVVGNAEFVDEVDPNEVNVEVVTSHELARNCFSIVPGSC